MCGNVLESAERLPGGDPQLLEDARRDLSGLVVGKLPELGTRPETLDEQGAELVVPVEQPGGADAVPAVKRMRVVLGLLVREVDLQDGVARRDDKRVTGLDRVLEVQRPAVGELFDDPGQPVEPPGAARLVAPPVERSRKLDQVRAPTTSAASSATSVGVVPTRTPQASSASFFAWAVPELPEMIAPAWPIVFPGGAVNPAM